VKKIIGVLFLLILLTTSAVWAAANEMNLKVGDPGTGAELTIGSVNTVKWSFRGDLGQTVMIRLQRLGWVNAQMTLAEAAPIGANRSGTYKWQIPADLPPGGNYTMTVVAENGISEMSGELKLIAGKTPVSKLEIDAPLKVGERWQTGSKMTIRWSYAGNPGQSIKLALIKKDEGAVTVIASTIPVGINGQGSYEWTVPSLKPGTDYYVGIVSNTNAFYQDLGKTPVIISAAK